MKFDKNNPWLVGIGVGVVSGLLAGLLVGVIFLHREERLKESIRMTRLKFADRCLEAGLAEDALEIYDDVLEREGEKDGELYAHMRNQTARCYLCLAKKGRETTRNLIRAAVAFEEGIRSLKGKKCSELVYGELELSGTYWSLAWFQEAEGNIAKAVGLFEDVLELYPELEYRAPFPLMGISLGDDLFTMVDREFPNIEKDIKKGIQHGEETLKLCTREKYPIAYALVQTSLGFYHLELAYFEDKTGNINKSVEEFEEALKIFTAQEYPLNHIDLRSSMALAYLCLSDVKNDEENIEYAIRIIKKVVTIATLEKYPYKYAQTQQFLASTYDRLSTVKDKEENITKAIGCCKNALKVYKESDTPFQFGRTQYELGTLYSSISRIREKAINVVKAADCLEKALRAFESCKTDESTVAYASVQESLGYGYLCLSRIKDKEANITKAVEAFEKALKVLSAEKQPRMYQRVRRVLQCAKEAENVAGEEPGK